MIQEISELYKSIEHVSLSNAVKFNIKVFASAHYIDFIMDKKIIRINVKHFVYSNDIITSFNYYHEAVKSKKMYDFELVDYSQPNFHEVVGFELMPIHFPSFSEPVVTTTQYLDFAKINEGSVVLDLGAYAGLTSILFKEKAGKSGQVIAIDADDKNIDSLCKNIKLYNRITDNKIEVLNMAVWIHDDGIVFSSEGNMGSSAADIVGVGRGDTNKIKSMKLSSIAKFFDLKKVDFIKCDIEGAENVIFEDIEFFNKFKPRIIIETHLVGGRETTAKCIQDLEKFGYTCKRIHQIGVALPLVECIPR